MVIFVTGKSGSGKSTFARELADKLNYEYVDVDKIGHSIYEGNVLLEVVKLFGDDILDNGIINRKKLGKKLFTEKDQSKIDKFNDITGEAIRHKVEPYLLKDVVVEWILLPLTKFMFCMAHCAKAGHLSRRHGVPLWMRLPKMPTK